MALTVGELAVELEARTREFRSGLQRAERQVDSLERKADRGTKNVGRSFARLAGGAGLVVGAIGAIGGALAAIGIGRFAVAGIKAAATFEKIGVQLEVLTGSATGARQVLDDINKLVVETPFGLEELSKAAASVAVVFGENTEMVREFTAISADLAAAFGRPVEQIGENLTRAFSSGLGAADALREAGITAEVLRITGATDVAKISSEQLANALRQITAEGGKAFGAAAAQAKTLDGALSNTGIALQNFQRSFGEAIQPQVVFLLNDVVIPAFQRLENFIRDNQVQIRELADRAIPRIISAFRSFVGIIASLLRGLGFVVKGFKALQVVGAVIQAWVVSGIASWRTLGTIVFNAGQIIGRIVTAIGLALVGRFGAARDQLDGVREDWDDMKSSFQQGQGDVDAALGVVKDRLDDVSEAGSGLDSLADSLENAGDKAVGFAQDAIVAGRAARALQQDAEPEGGAAEGVTPSVFARRTQAQVQGMKALENIIRTTRREREGELSVLQKQLNAIDDQIRKVQALNVHKQDEIQRTEALALLEDRRKQSIDDAAAAEAQLGQLQAQNQQALAQLARFDPETAASITTEMTKAISAAELDPAKQVEIATGFAETIAEALGEVVPPSLSESLAESVTGTFRSALQGEAFSFGDALGSVLETRATDALNRAFEESLTSFGDALESIMARAGDVLGGAFEEGGLFGGLGQALGFGEGFGELFGNAALGVLGAGFQALTAGDDATSQAADIQSAVTSSERVRGIVAGPTQIAVAQVDRAISDAFIETNRILARIEENTRRTANDAAPSGGGSLQTGGASEATEALANESPTIS